ncbi:Ubiquitin-like-specific protease ESD4 [Dichanthelium oligosanthes]|uniref:Ubiquitin-like-specific protease ESD4 n=1 Tax=Dichanthelium oligosanthes TaxID=888268 RepID=A0A1E5VEK8_9POAL|nr:Ubiquitin-like-specific protease ESD4 [Dichanthelium oligosanthes]
MGALTDSRKRLTADHRLPIPSFPPPSPPPPSKRPKLATFPSSFDPSTSANPPPNPSPQIIHPAVAAAAAASTSNTPGPSSSSNPASSALPNRRGLPPPPPFKRPIHGPQRVLRAFRFRDSARPHAIGPPWLSPSSPPLPPPRTLGLEQYVELVNSVSHPAPPTPTATTNAAKETEAVPLEMVAIEEDGDEREQQDDDNEEVVRGSVVVRRVPLYKELYEASGRKRDAKLKTLEFEVRLAEEGHLGLERLKEVLPRITPKKQDVPEPFVPLTDEDEEIVREALHGRNSRERLAVHEPSNIVITREILQCLNNQEWLNDEVINLYLDLLKERELREPGKFLKCHFFNTFFYKKLISGGYDYKAVRRWTTKRKLGYNLIECDKVKHLWILFSSARYFVDEVKDKSGQQIDALSWKQEGVKNLPLQENGYLSSSLLLAWLSFLFLLVPVQIMNSFFEKKKRAGHPCHLLLFLYHPRWDCGMFMLKYIDFYSRDMDLIFGQKHMRYFRRRTAKEILNLRAE